MRAHAPSPTHFYWTMFARKDQNTLIEQSTTLIEQSLFTFPLKFASNCLIYLQNMWENTLSELIKYKRGPMPPHPPTFIGQCLQVKIKIL